MIRERDRLASGNRLNPEIEITPDMIEAAVNEIETLDGGEYGPRFALCREIAEKALRAALNVAKGC